MRAYPKFHCCAVTARAEAIISWDTHLLSLSFDFIGKFVLVKNFVFPVLTLCLKFGDVYSLSSIEPRRRVLTFFNPNFGHKSQI